MALNVQVFCKISDYLAKHYPRVAKILDATCNENSLGTRGRPGTTFLVPDDATVAKIEKLVTSTNVDDVSAASDMVSMLIVRDKFENGPSWKSKTAVSALNQIIDVDSARGTEVTFKCGAKAVIDSKFNDGSKKKNLAVWKLSGEIPVTTDREASPADIKTGSYAPTLNESQRFRNRIMLVVENAFVDYLHDPSTQGEKCDPLTRYLFSFVHWCRYGVVNGKELLYQRVIPLLCCDRIDLYFFVEPHKPEGQVDYFIPDEVIDSWWQNKDLDVSPMQVCDELYQSILHPEMPDDSLFYSNRAELLSKLRTLRSRLLASAESRPRSVVDQIHKQYLDVAASNMLDGVKLFPDALGDFYKKYPMMKMVQDELRFITYWKFNEFCRDKANFDAASYNSLLNIIGEMLYTCYNGTAKNAQKLLSAEQIKYSIAPTESINEVKIFVNSTCFMHVALAPSEYAQLGKKQCSDRPDTNKILFNISNAIHQKHERLIDYRYSDSTVAKLLMLDPNVLPEGVREKLRNKFT